MKRQTDALLTAHMHTKTYTNTWWYTYLRCEVVRWQQHSSHQGMLVTRPVSNKQQMHGWAESQRKNAQNPASRILFGVLWCYCTRGYTRLYPKVQLTGGSHVPVLRHALPWASTDLSPTTNRRNTYLLITLCFYMPKKKTETASKSIPL
jgi:hypothetical protein